MDATSLRLVLRDGGVLQVWNASYPTYIMAKRKCQCLELTAPQYAGIMQPGGERVFLASSTFHCQRDRPFLSSRTCLSVLLLDLMNDEVCLLGLWIGCDLYWQQNWYPCFLVSLKNGMDRAVSASAFFS